VCVVVRYNVCLCCFVRYASPGIVILGLALAQHYNASTWQEFNQLLAALPATMAAGFTDTAFPGEELCSDDPAIVHQYAYEVNANPDPNATGADAVLVTFPDITKYVFCRSPNGKASHHDTAQAENRERCG
jgi:hypothetical protein